MLKVIILYPNSFPIGGAATNRIFHIAKAIQLSGNNVNIICTRGTEKKDNVINIHSKGVYNGIPFSYSVNSVIWPNSQICKLLNILKGLISTIRIFFLNKNNIDIVICYANYSFLQNLFFFVSCKMIKAKYVYIVDEYPWSIINRKNSFYDKFYLRLFFKFFDGFIVMTNVLLKYYKSLSKSSAKFVQIPMTVDLQRFKMKLKNKSEDYIVYCGGDITGTKDGLDILVKSFNLIKNQYPSLKLYIVGRVHESIERLVNELSLQKRVVFYGFVSSDKIPEILINAKLLCLSRPNNIQSEGGFPTKLGEYLASGTPVVVTDTGEISQYLKHGLNAFIAKPNDISDFSNKIVWALDNYEESLIVGKNGRILAESMFDYTKYHKIINDFLYSLLTHKYFNNGN